ncbi:MAG TPA: hypothetical protein VEI97_15495 [bacterium]|nr:hypothetical protein [bacterium]
MTMIVYQIQVGDRVGPKFGFIGRDEKHWIRRHLDQPETRCVQLALWFGSETLTLASGNCSGVRLPAAPSALQGELIEAWDHHGLTGGAISPRDLIAFLDQALNELLA